MIFNSFWYGDRLPLHAAACMTSFVKAGHQYRLYTYAALKVPRGVEIRDAGEILSEDEVFLDVKPDGTVGNVAAFSDLFRYALLDRHGGWWVDTDVLCMGGPMPESELYFAWEDDAFINGAILRAPPGHALIRRLEERARSMGRSPKRGVMGPPLVTEVVRELGLSHLAAPREEAYPVHYEDYRDLVEAGPVDAVWRSARKACFVHLWNEMFRGETALLLRAPERGSFMSKIYRDNLPLHQYLVVCGRQARKAIGRSRALT